MSNAVVPAIPLDPAVPDPYLWLEEVEGDDALGWVEERNAETMRTLGSTDLFAANRDAIREVLDSDDRIPEVTRRGDFLYNFWRDADHERGLWRRTTLDSYRTAAPQGEVLLDLDALAAADDTAWVWHGAEVLRPADPAQPWRRALIALSVGGSDADVTREFDLETRQFIAPTAGGFHREEAKGGLTWVDADTVYCHTDFGDGSLTTSGYPRTVRLWRRGTPLAEAPVVYEGEHDDMVIYAGRSSTPGFERDFVSRVMTFYTSQTYLVRDVGTPEQELIHLEVPDSAMIGAHREWLLVTLRDDWTIEERTHLAGSLLVIDFDAFLGGSRDFTTLFTPTPSTSLAGAAWTLSHLVLNVLDDVKNRVTVLTPPPLEESPEGAPRGPEGGGDCPWLAADLPISDPISTLVVRAVDPRVSDDVWVTSTSFLRPSTLSLGRIGSDGTVALEPLKAAPAFFAGDGLQAEQRFATSDDGTRIPYFIVGRPEQLHPAGADHWPAPTMLWGYGGFEIAVTPSYNPTVGRAWLERGGVYVIANIRGGGEYGPAWHQAALRENRHKAYEDFAAVARELVATGITDVAHLGCEGRSNGGLLAGNMLTTYPELFGAIMIGVPLLDMRRYSHLLAGASWMAEYGNPDVDSDWEFLKHYSAYHNVSSQIEYPPTYIYTSTKDDRVHPGHARKFAALLREAGVEVTYYENVEGGHGGAANNAQSALMDSLRFTFLGERLGLA